MNIDMNLFNFLDFLKNTKNINTKLKIVNGGGNKIKKK